jgi:hypothetical protein
VEEGGAQEDDISGRGHGPGRGRGGGHGRGPGRGRGSAAQPLQHPPPQQQAQPLIFDEEAIEAEIHDTMQARIAPGAQGCYTGYTVRIVKFLFYYRDVLNADVIKAAFFEQVLEAHEQDVARVRPDGTQYKHFIHLDNSIKTAIANIRADDESTHPLHLGNLSFKIIAFFMHMTMRKEIDVPGEDNVEDEDVHIDVDGDFNDGGADQQQDNEEANADEEESNTNQQSRTKKVKIRLKASSFDGVQSSIANIYTDCNFARDFNETTKEFWWKIGQYRKGTRRKGARVMQGLGL